MGTTAFSVSMYSEIPASMRRISNWACESHSQFEALLLKRTLCLGISLQFQDTLCIRVWNIACYGKLSSHKCVQSSPFCKNRHRTPFLLMRVMFKYTLFVKWGPKNFTWDMFISWLSPHICLPNSKEYFFTNIRTFDWLSQTWLSYSTTTIKSNILDLPTSTFILSYCYF